MSAAAIAVGVGAAAAIGTGVASAEGQKDAAAKQQKTAAEQYAQQQANTALATASARSDVAPWVSTGQQANATLSGMLGLRAEDLQPPDKSMYQSPVFVGGKYQMVTNEAAYAEAVRNYVAQYQKLKAVEKQYGTGSLLKPFDTEAYKRDFGYTPMVNTLEELQATPGYQFRLQQGLQAINNSAAAKGSLLSGGAIKDINDYAQGHASTEYQNAWERAQNAYQQAFSRNLGTKAQQYSMLSGASGQGLMGATNQAGNAMQGAGMNNQSSQNYTNQSNAATQAFANAQSNEMAAINQGIQGAISSGLGAYLNMPISTGKNSQPMSNLLQSY